MSAGMLGVVAVVLVASCTADAEQTATPPTSIETDRIRFHATLIQWRADTDTNRIDVQLTNRSYVSVRVETVHIVWPGVAAAATSENGGTDYDPGRTIDIKADYGDTVCDDRASREVKVEVTLADGNVLLLPVDRAGSASLRHLAAADCDLKAITAVANIELSSTFTQAPGGGGDRLLGTVTVTRTARSRQADRSRLSVEGFLGSVLLDLSYAGKDELPLWLEPGDASIRVPVAITPARCDSHALGESQQTFLFGVGVGVEGSEPRLVTVVPGAVAKRQASALVERVCG